MKETALDDFDLPIKLKYGYLSSLVLKIPWKNLYNEPVIATVDGLNLIVVPNKGVVYNEEKAAKNIQEIKQKTLARLEEARKERRKPKDPQADTFTEKMITQIIKNLQVEIYKLLKYKMLIFRYLFRTFMFVSKTDTPIVIVHSQWESLSRNSISRYDLLL